MEKKRQTLAALTLKKKYELIQAVQNAPASSKKKDIAAEFKIPSNTLSTIMKNKDHVIEKYHRQDIEPERKSFRSSAFTDIDEALLIWFEVVCDRNAAVSGPIMKEKANNLAKMLGHPDFRCSDGWLDRFKHRHNIKLKNVCGESADVVPEDLSDWLSKDLPALLKQYSPKDIFNADETGIFWRMMPNKTMCFKAEACHGGKQSKERVTALACANMDGTEKIDLLTIGKFRNPRCFKGIQHLPTLYKANKKAWMVSTIFEEWLRKLDRKFKRQVPYVY